MITKLMVCLVPIFGLMVSTTNGTEVSKPDQGHINNREKSKVKGHNLSIVQIGVEPTQFIVGDRVHVFVEVVNHGKVIENNASVNLTVSSQGIDMVKNIAAITPGEIVEVNFACIMGRRKSELIEVSALVETIAKEKRVRSKTKKVKYNYVYEADGDVVVLYKVEPPVHQWIAFQAYKKLPEGPLKDEIHGYLPTSSSDPYYLPGFDTSGWSNNYNSFYISLRALIEGAWEEDKPFIEGRWMAHYWNPDGGYDDGLYIGFKSALQKAQEDLWQDAISTYNNDQTAQAYYLLGRIAHLLMDMSVPAHTLLDEHPIEDRYEEFTGDNYKNITSSSPNTGIPSGLPSYPQSTPTSYDDDLTKLFYNFAEKSDDFDSDDEDGESTDYGKGKYTFGRNALDASRTFSRAEYFVWTLLSGWEKERDLVRYVDYDIFRSCINSNEYHIYYYRSFYDEYNNSLTHWVKVYYTDGSSEFVDWDLEELGGVPDSVLECIHQKQLQARAVGYVAALYQLFWDETHETPPPCSPGDDLFISSTPWNDDNSDSDQDGVVEEWETGDLQIRLRSGSDVTSVEATLTSTKSGVLFQDDYNWYGSISASEGSYGDGDYNIEFNFSVSQSIESCPFTLHVTYQKDSVEYCQELVFNKDVYEQDDYYAWRVPDYTIDDSPSIKSQNNGDGIFQSGEKVHIRPRLCNDGIAAATRIDVTLLYDGDGLDVTPGDERYVDLAPGGCGYPTDNDYFRIDAYNNFTGSESLDVQIIWHEGPLDGILLPDEIELEVEPAPWIDVDPRQWDFGVSRTDEDVVKTVTINNYGSANLTVTGIVPSISDASWIGDPLPWTIPAGGSKDFQVVLETENLQGLIDFEVVVESDGRLMDPTPPSDRISISGLVSDTYPTYEVPGVINGDKPDANGNMIVYRNGNGDIYGYDLASGTEFAVCTNPEYQGMPRISGNIVVWEDYRNADESMINSDIYGYDLDTGQEFEITTDPMREELIGLDCNFVAFIRGYDTIEDEYGEYIAYNALVYEYQGNGQWLQRYTTGFTPGTGYETRQTTDNEGDFGGGMLIFERFQWTWMSQYGNWSMSEGDQYVVKIDFANGETCPTGVTDHFYDPYSATTHRFVFTKDDGDNDQVWLWDDGSVSQITTEPRDHADDNLAISGDIIVYDKRNLPGLYYWNLNTRQETWLTEQTSNYPDDSRMDGNLVVWSRYDTTSGNRGIYYAFANQADISLKPADITFSSDQPYEGEVIDVNVTVHNLSPKDVTQDITVRIYDGDPDANGIQLNSNEVIVGGIAGRSDASVTFNSIPVGIEGSHNIYVCIAVPISDNPANNKAYRVLTVNDTDTEGPIISDVIVEEYNGDGDGWIEDEQILISWQATDISGINSSWCTIDTNDFAASGTYYVIVGPFVPGTYEFTISATDGDISPEASDFSGRFRVHTCDLFSDGLVNFLDYAILVRNWLNYCLEPDWCEGADLNSSGEVNIADFSIFTDKWLTGI